MFTTNSTEIWENEVRPVVESSMILCTTDPIFVLSCEHLINHIDSDIVSGTNMAFRIEPMIKVLSTQRYYTETLKNAYPDEIKQIKSLLELLSMLHKVAKHELGYTKQEEVNEIRDRLPNGTIEKDVIYNVPVNTRPRL